MDASALAQAFMAFVLGGMVTATIGALTFGRTLAVLVVRMGRVEADVQELTRVIQRRREGS